MIINIRLLWKNTQNHF